MRRVKCSIVFYYDPETYIYETDEAEPSEEKILNRCRDYMLEDVTQINEPFEAKWIDAEFVGD